MKNHEHTKIAFIALGIALLWWLVERNKAFGSTGDVSLPATSNDPQLDAFAANPSAFLPASLGNVNINIGNQGLGYLSNQYIPLFGFVGMAQGVMYG